MITKIHTSHNHNTDAKQCNCERTGSLLMLSLPEQVEMLLLHMRQRLQRGVVQPAALDDHLHQVTDADGCHQPALTGSDVQHRLRTSQEQVGSVNERVMASRTLRYDVGSCGSVLLPY